jgi:hypothetical protein
MKRKIDHCGNDCTRVAETERDGAEREPMQEIHGPVNGVEHPKQLLTDRIAAFFFAQKGNLWRLIAQEVAHGALDSQVHF